MPTLNVTYHCRPGMRDAFFSAVTRLGVRQRSVTEAGNIKYDYYFDAQDPDVLLLVESWTDAEHQLAHTQSETCKKLQDLKAQYCAQVELDRFES